MNLNAYPLEDGFETTLSQSWDGSVGTINVNSTPSFTFPAGVKTYVVVNPTNSKLQIAEVDSYDAVAKTLNVSSITTEKGASVASTQNTHPVNSTLIISDNFQFWSDIATAINSKIDADDGLGVIYTDETARDAALISPTNGMQVYVTSLGVFTDYIAGAWSNRAVGSTPNGDESTAGKFQQSTDVAFDTGTDLGSTGAQNTPKNSQIQGMKTNDDIGIPGEVRMWTTDSAPTSWFICDGQAINRTTYATLFSVIGTTYGVGDGATTFNVPDLKGNVVVGKDVGQVEFDNLGETGGSKTHTLTENEMPVHNHGLRDTNGSGFGTNEVNISGNGGNSPVYVQDVIQDTGGGNAHNILQPYTTLNYIIKS